MVTLGGASAVVSAACAVTSAEPIGWGHMDSADEESLMQPVHQLELRQRADHPPAGVPLTFSSLITLLTRAPPRLRAQLRVDLGGGATAGRGRRRIGRWALPAQGRVGGAGWLGLAIGQVAHMRRRIRC